ncbi:hypothetical protein, partial [Pseudoalteromonas haloplanktis]|uniref:hypothetical protein n=1 Tax=Pseudoalteromonas haloplanktis TaxID=228 RepID=UPI0021D4C7BE
SVHDKTGMSVHAKTRTGVHDGPESLFTMLRNMHYTPSSSFKALITDDKSIIPIDLRFLQLARAKDIVLAHDLYLFLIRRGYGR